MTKHSHEFKVMRTMSNAILTLSPEEQYRVMNWLQSFVFETIEKESNIAREMASAMSKVFKLGENNDR